MSKSKQVTKITEIVTQAAPELQFVAAYNTDDRQLNGSMKLYQKRSFVYVLTLHFKGEEAVVYVGETHFQYARLLQHQMTFCFDRMYLYECEESALRVCEEAVIRRLTPLFNKSQNPLSARYNRVLDIDNVRTNDREEVIRCLEKWDEYCDAGLFGFALPSVLFRLLKAEATAHKKTVSEELTEILESFFADDIAGEVKKKACDEEKTNLLTTSEFGEKYGKSQEQVKQYLQQEGRVAGTKIGRDWVMIDDEKYPADRRKKDTII